MMFYIRYQIARVLIHVGLFVLPDCAYKTELLSLIYELKDKVIATVTAARASANPQQLVKNFSCKGGCGKDHFPTPDSYCPGCDETRVQEIKSTSSLPSSEG